MLYEPDSAELGKPSIPGLMHLEPRLDHLGVSHTQTYSFLSASVKIQVAGYTPQNIASKCFSFRFGFPRQDFAAWTWLS